MSRAATPPEVADDWFGAMRRGDWEAAWRATDRLEIPRRAAQRTPGFVPRPEHLVWDGTPLAGRSVMVRCDHGLGDTLQFMRFLPRLRARELHFMVQPHLLALLRGAPGLGQVHDWWTDAPFPPHELQVEVMELAYALRCTLDDVPPPYPHLRRQLPAGNCIPAGDGRLRVGLLWSASDWDPTRSLSLPALAPLLEVPGVRFFSLQQGPPAQDPLLAGWPITPLSHRTAAVEDAAAAMCGLDLVLCVDGMPAHLAATLGRPTWVLLKQEADWRWMDARTDTPWYPTMRLFRQRRGGDWGEVVQEVAQALRALASDGRARPALSAGTTVR